MWGGLGGGPAPSREWHLEVVLLLGPTCGPVLRAANAAALRQRVAVIQLFVIISTVTIICFVVAKPSLSEKPRLTARPHPAPRHPAALDHQYGVSFAVTAINSRNHAGVTLSPGGTRQAPPAPAGRITAIRGQPPMHPPARAEAPSRHAQHGAQPAATGHTFKRPPLSPTQPDWHGVAERAQRRRPGGGRRDSANPGHRRRHRPRRHRGPDRRDREHPYRLNDGRRGQGGCM